ncbi:hypothetical protein OQZ33_11265 [Pedobacter sp. MC2016-05]|uniref:hypothetical protein n=1 Tax=Pedobacter sp. MC2016-05 TaxID=2994474 RepID=UPI0022481CF4|nr:hypothetical protein [Pedobacter sp. MC2016-05]MCX2474911.1 hypothetical protein [Pedobacter sp. MC2016-05]
MIKLHYIHEDPTESLGFCAYLLLQEENQQSFIILNDDEILGQIELINGYWRNLSDQKLDEQFVQSIGKFLKGQQFLKLPKLIKDRWPMWVEEVIVQSESMYLIVAKPNIEFHSFEKIFRDFIPQLVKDEWLICFKVYDAKFEAGFELEV